ncbi:hypothetical protein FXO37_00413 [Capsicum annuum]|nr:hypothetical protein FXO37_00413 [Capsicum annuum]
MAIWVDNWVKQHEWGIFGPNRCAIAHGFGGGPEIRVEKREKRREWGIFGLNECAVAHGFRDGPGAWCAVGCGKTGKTDGTGHSRAKWVFYSPWFQGWDRGSGETAQIGGFQTKSVCYCPWFRGWSWVRACYGSKIDRGMPGRLEIIPGLGVHWPKIDWDVSGRLGIVPVRPGVQACCWEKIDRVMPRRLEIMPLRSVYIFVAIWVDKRAKRHERGIFEPNKGVIAHSFEGGPGIRACCGMKSTGACQGGWRSSQSGPFNFSWPFGWTNRRNSINGAFSGVLLVENQSGRAREVGKRVKRHERIFGPNGCAIAHGFGGSIVIFDFREGLEPTSGKIIQGVLPAEYIRGKQLYIVHSVGELFVITRDGIFNNPRTITNSYGVKQFIVHKVDVDTEHYEKVDDLGNRSFFLGYSASLSVEQYGCKANHIYFTDDCFSAFYFHERGGGKDMGVYNLFDNTIESHYTDESCHRFSPPIWIFNAPFSI